MATPGDLGLSSHRADLGHSRTVTTPQLLVGPVGDDPPAPAREPPRPASGGTKPSSRLTPSFRQTRTISRSARPEPIPSAASFLDHTAHVPGSMTQSLEGEADHRIEAFLRFQCQCPIIPGACLRRREMRLGMGDDLEPGRFLGRHLGLLHPPLPLFIGACGDDRRRCIAKKPSTS